MSAIHNTEVANQWFAAFNEHDLEKLLALYDEEAQHYSPKLKVRQPATNGYISGKDALRSWWQDAFDRLPTLQYDVLTITTNEDRVFMEYIRRVADEPDMQVGEVLEIQDGVIVGSRVYHS